MLTVPGSTRVLILIFMFLKYDFFVFIFDAIFCDTNFSFLRTVCGYLSHLDVFIVVSIVKTTG